LCAKKRYETTVRSVACSECGKPVSRKESEVQSRSKYGPFCSHPCYSKWRTKHLSGANSPGWRGGIRKHYSGSWKAVRRVARKRDNHTCQDCGATRQKCGYQLDVHHIVDYELFDDPFEANDLSNLVTLCRPCHTKRHLASEIFELEKVS